MGCHDLIFFDDVLIAVKGFGAAETSQAFERALELCHKFEGWPQATTVISGMIGVHLMREEFEHAQTLARGLLQSTGRPDDAQRLMGHRALVTSLFYVGELTGACEHLSAAIELYESLGFQGQGIRRGYYTDNREDALIMWLDPVVRNSVADD